MDAIAGRLHKALLILIPLYGVVLLFGAIDAVRDLVWLYNYPRPILEGSLELAVKVLVAGVIFGSGFVGVLRTNFWAIAMYAGSMLVMFFTFNMGVNSCSTQLLSARTLVALGAITTDFLAFVYLYVLRHTKGAEAGNEA